MANNRPVVANLDFASIKEDMIAYFKSREEFKDYEFTGSGLNLLLDILAYNTHYNALTANFLVNEMFLDTAIMRNNVVSLAKSLNYTPRTIRASSSTVKLKFTQQNGEQFLIIPGGTPFSAASGNSSLNFYTIKPYTLIFSDVEQTIDVEVFEGQIFTQRFINNTPNAKFAYFDLSNENIDSTTITVSVNGVTFTEVTPENEGITNVTERSNVYFVEETRNNSLRIVFGNDVIGKALNNGDEVVVTYLTTNGPEGNGVSNFAPSIPGRPDVEVVSASVSQGGDKQESIREIKANAPHWFQSQYRAVTERDYEVFIRKKYPDIQSINVYGGEKVGRLGRVFICIKPKSADFLTDVTKNAIVSDILSNSNVVTITPFIVDPEYIDLNLKTVVIVDTSQGLADENTIKTSVYALLNIFNTEYIGDFMKSFRTSELSNQVYELDNSIQGVNTRLTLSYSIESKNQKLNTYSWSFKNRIYHPEQGFLAKEGGVVTSSLFTRVGRDYQSGFDDDGFGNLRLFDFIDDTKIYINSLAGRINYVTGEIDIITELDAEDGVIEFTCVPDSFDVETFDNTLLRINIQKTEVSVVDKNKKPLLSTLNLNRSI